MKSQTLLAGRAPSGPISLMKRVYKYVLPEVRAELGLWRARAEAIADPELRKQALDSMNAKQFHCEGGGVYAAANLEQRQVLIPLIVALQTISDYLIIYAIGAHRSIRTISVCCIKA